MGKEKRNNHTETIFLEKEENKNSDQKFTNLEDMKKYFLSLSPKIKGYRITQFSDKEFVIELVVEENYEDNFQICFYSATNEGKPERIFFKEDEDPLKTIYTRLFTEQKLILTFLDKKILQGVKPKQPFLQYVFCTKEKKFVVYTQQIA